MRTPIRVRTSLHGQRTLFSTRRRILIASACAVAAVFALCALWVVSAVWLRIALALPRNVTMQYDAASYGWQTVHFEGLSIGDRDGTTSLRVPVVDIRGIGLASLFGQSGPAQISIHTPQLTLSSAAARPAALHDGFEVFSRWSRWVAGSSMRIDGGSVEVRATDGTVPLIAFDGISGELAVGTLGRLSYDVKATCRYESGSYGVHGHASEDSAGTVNHHWTAAALPLVPVLAVLRTDPPLAGLGGALHGVDAAFHDTSSAPAAEPRLHVTAHLEGADVTIGSAHHRIHGLHGLLTLVDDGIASPRLAGTMGDVPLDVVGEVHDIHGAPFAWFTNGSADLRTLVSLADKVASQDKVRSVRLETVAPGIAFAQYAADKSYGPLVVTVASVDPAEPTLRFDTVMAQDHITSRGERTSAMAVRTGAILGINGDYYDIGATWAPQGIVIRSGTLLRTPAQRMALTVHRDHRVSFQEYRFSGTLRVAGRDYPLTQLNNWPAGDVTLITPEYGKIPPAPEVTLASLVPVDVRRESFRVGSVFAASTETPPSFALAVGPRVHVPLRTGELVTVHYNVLPSAADAVAAIGGGPLLLRNGAWYEDPHPPAPDERDVHWAVVAVGRMPDDSLLVFQVDGRHPERSIGMTRPDFAALMRDFGVVDAMALDSGGSATIVARAPGDPAATLRNHPSDNDGERWVSNGLFLYSSAPEGHLLTAAASATAALAVSTHAAP